VPRCCTVGYPQPKNLWGGSAGDSGRYSARPANLERGVALFVADRLLNRKNNKLFPQTCDENRRPIFMIADLNRNDFARAESLDLRFELARLLFNLSKRPRDLAGRIENGGLIALSRQRLVPRCQQCVFGFHRLQETACADTFRAPLGR